MDPWRPKYKPLYDAIEHTIQVMELAALAAAFFAIVILTL